MRVIRRSLPLLNKNKRNCCCCFLFKSQWFEYSTVTLAGSDNHTRSNNSKIQNIQVGTDHSKIIANFNNVKKYFDDNLELYKKISLIERYLNSQEKKIRIGLITNDVENKKLLTCLLVDPWDPKNWYGTLIDRDLTNKNNLIQYNNKDVIEISHNDEEKLDIYKIQYNERLLKNQSNFLEFLEINNLKLKHVNNNNNNNNNNREEIEKLEIIPIIKETENVILERKKNFDCHLYLFIKSFIYEKLPDESFANWPILSIINTNDEILLKRNNEEELVIDIDCAVKANELLIKSPSNSTEYLKLIQNCNINKFFNNFFKLTNDIEPIIELYKSVIEQLYLQIGNELSYGISYQLQNNKKLTVENYLNINLKMLENLKAKNELLISEWNQNSHFELQEFLQPFLNNNLKLNFPQLMKFIIKIDDLDLILENLLFNNENGFLNSTNENFNILIGKIDSISSGIENEEKKFFLKNPLKILEKNVFTKINFLQIELYDFIMSEFWKVQIPIISIATISHIFYNFELNTILSIILIGSMISLNKISKKMINEIDLFKKWYLENLRITIKSANDILRERLNTNIHLQIDKTKSKFNAVENLEKGLLELKNLKN
ncbi:hypothetical protein PACTADRAFT_36036 [Pachysolen tannophilus NRRL Y-2460]|uniref:Mmc1 C-terminal domain-containing protein n=1 Tax=Pachysolen tannophilus NRRL Y-2460 TaxID=669874 RepID=A0A1E4TNU6_PACTA|nr:hypothetical protein PACTADRAFT_36036 [Pachysolen tannophilus NRRL Y-2460]